MRWRPGGPWLRSGDLSSSAMVMLDVITKTAAAAEIQTLPARPKYPITLNPDENFHRLHLRTERNSNDSALINPVHGWDLSDIDSHVTDSTNRFFDDLKGRLEVSKIFTKGEFLSLVDAFLEQNAQQFGVSVDTGSTGEIHTSRLVKKMGFLINSDLAVLISEFCISVELWVLLEALIVQRVIRHPYSGELINKLIEKKPCMLCLCLKKATDLQPSDIHAIMKFFLSTRSSKVMKEVRKEWEIQAVSAVDKAAKKKSGRAMHTAFLLMAAHDGFSASEQGLHYLFTSPNVDGPALSWAIHELEGREVMRLVGYLGKWLMKYERFPQAVSISQKAAGLENCKWVPSLDRVANCLGVVIDEHFSYLVLQRDFHGELKMMAEKVRALADEAKFCCALADVVELVKSQKA